jgi:hypothetical protein
MGALNKQRGPKPGPFKTEPFLHNIRLLMAKLPVLKRNYYHVGAVNAVQNSCLLIRAGKLRLHLR